jgi:ATPase subunit of ABC transporter with duplicated ATPase domains
MPATLRTIALGAARADADLFSGLDLTVGPGDVWGLTGPNGAGKSTLLTLLASADAGSLVGAGSQVGASSPAGTAPGTPPPDGGSAPEVTGRVSLAPPSATVGLLAQEPDRSATETIGEMIARRTGVAAAEAEMDAAAADLSRPGASQAEDDRYAAALERWLGLGGADLAERTEEVVSRLGLTASVATPTAALSGGQAARASLAVLLLQRYDVLLLDEPTNDLDLDGLEQLERFVVEARAGIVVVSHDREFLARTTTGIVELDSAQRRVTVYEGGYESYLEERALARRREREAYEEYADTVDSLRARHQRQKEWVTVGLKNARRKNPDPDKHIRHRNIARTEKLASKISQTERAIERLEEVVEPRKEWELRMSVAEAPRSGTVVATLDAVVVRRGDCTLGPVTAEISYGDRVVLTGANGSGKTTLLAAILGRLTPGSGRASLGSGVVVGEVDQARELFDSPEPLARMFADTAGLSPEEGRTLLAKFALDGDKPTRPAATLSPGERTRAALALLQARGVNLLVLDEPTNHLDLPAVEQLEQAVESFAGTVLLVTHDRRMLAGVRATRRWSMADGTLTEQR